jgi:DNA-directed RNA polymerase subunit RPC12/RpoP
MTKATYFVQECPTCGRRLQIRVEYLGKRVACQHCRGQFDAIEPTNRAPNLSDSSLSILARVEELLATTEDRKPAAG